MGHIENLRREMVVLAKKLAGESVSPAEKNVEPD
jgi:hypothetical protein